MRLIDNLLNKFTMYQVVFYLLGVLIFISFGLVLIRVLPYNPVLFVQNAAIIFTISYITNFVFTKIFKAYSSIQSTIITAFILILITPIQFNFPFWIFVLIPFIAIASKYLIAYKKVHIFNPAAFGVAIVGFLSAEYAATWWIGTPAMLFPVLICGFLILRKINKFTMFFTFVALVSVFSFAITFFQGRDLSSALNFVYANLTQSALIFFASVMLTEPITSPTRRTYQKYYVALIAVLYSTNLLSLPGVIITLELSLLVGNIFAFIVNPKYRLSLKLRKKIKLTSDLYEFEFEKPKDFKFIPGQYLNWTLPHKKEDSRGNRRYFSIASSPTEDKLILSFRKYEPSSSFKKAMIDLSENEKVIASNLSGDFVLPARLASERVAGRPNNLGEKLAFVAGGIGITPFRSMIKYLIDKKIVSDIVLLYVVKKKEDLIFMDLFSKSSRFGIKVIPLVGKYELVVNDFKENVPDYRNRAFYISGPHPMVQNFKSILKKLGTKKIEVDFFPGYK